MGSFWEEPRPRWRAMWRMTCDRCDWRLTTWPVYTSGGVWRRSKRGCGCGWRGIDHAPHEKSQYFSWLFLKYSGSYAMISNADWLAGTILLRCFQLWDNLVHQNLLWVCGWFAPLATHSSVSVKRKEFCVAVSVKCFLPFSPFPSHLELTN